MNLKLIGLLFSNQTVGHLLAASLLLSACTNEKASPVNLPSLAKTGAVNSQNSEQTANLPADDTGTNQNTGNTSSTETEIGTQTFDFTDSGLSGRQRKTMEELRSSIEGCLGSTSAFDTDPSNDAFSPIFRVSTEMTLGGSSTALSEGRQAFMVVADRSTVVNKDILELQKQYLYSPGSSTSVRATAIEDEIFLNALQTVAFVAAFNCDVRDSTTSTPRCVCSSETTARAMLERCLPLFDPATQAFSDAVRSLSSTDNCGSSDLFNRRRAIASLLSSYAFATSR